MERACLPILKPGYPPSPWPKTKNRHFINVQLMKTAVERNRLFILFSFATDLECVYLGGHCFVCRESI